MRAGRGGDGWLCACMSSVANGGVGWCKLVVEGGAHRMRTRGASPSASEVSDMPALGDAPAVAVALPIFWALGPIFAFSCSWSGVYRTQGNCVQLTPGRTWIADRIPRYEYWYRYRGTTRTYLDSQSCRYCCQSCTAVPVLHSKSAGSSYRILRI